MAGCSVWSSHCVGFDRLQVTMTEQTLCASSLSLVCGVPCVLVGPSLAKHVLALVRAAGWHPKGHSRLVLDRRPHRIRHSQRAYQLSDTAVTQLQRLLDTTAHALLESDRKTQLKSPATSLVALIQTRSIDWQPLFPLHEFIVNPNRCDTSMTDSALPSNTITFLEAQHAPSRSASL